MKSRAAYLYRGLIIYLCAALLLPLIPAQTEAQVSSKAIKKVQVRLGKPQVWSIGQAHYLLANMRRVNRDLKTHMPTDSELNPNASNATRIQILKTLLNAEAQFSQKDAIGNQAAIRENQISLRNREEAQAALPAKKRELENRDRELLKLDKKIKEDELELTRMKKAREAQSTPPPPPSKEENDLELEIELRKIDRAQQKTERDALATEVANLNTTANGTVGAPTLAEPQFSTAPRLTTGDLSPLVGKALDKAANTAPSIAASIALDNYIAMQYEIIAKQMTLLRDEVGPEERVIFLELPTSLYTIPCKADNHMVQLQWQVEEYIEDDEKLAAALANEGAQGLRTDFEEIERQKVRLENIRAKYGNETNQRQEELVREQKTIDNGYNYRWQQVRGLKDEQTDKDPERLFENEASSNNDQAQRYAVRALDIVPRQSALNVNSTYNTISQINFLGVLKFITGLGIKVDYQRQQELYEQYLQQEVFASGYGKGSDTFGWTFAPLPGTKRVAPGVRTTYAILAIPRNASALMLKVNAITYPRGGTPNHEKGSPQVVAENKIIVRIPNEFTENFYVKEAIYTPVKKGERVGVLLKGDYFSPQLGVTVNGVPLTRALAITNNESADATALAASVAGVQGAYELISSHELYMTFSVVDTNIATPTITLVTPEKTSAINFFKLKINYHDELTSLSDLSKTEPMFFDGLDVGQKLQIINVTNHREINNPQGLPVPFIKARLDGRGLRRKPEIYIDDRRDRLPHRSDEIERLKENLIGQTASAENPGEVAVVARERLKRRLAQKYVDKIRDKLQAQNRYLTKTEEDRIRELRFEQLDNYEELYQALRKERVDANLPVREFEELSPNVEYVDQDSTGGYIIYFKQPQKAKWTVRYRNNTKQGYEEKVFEVERAFPLSHKLISYRPLQNGTAEVTLEFSTDNDRDNYITAIGINRGEGAAQGPLDTPCAPPRKPEPCDYRQTFSLTAQDGTQLHRDQITVTVNRNGMADPQIVTITLPLQPAITAIENPNQENKAQGYVDEEPAVVIRGTNLHHADKIFFGNKEATKFGEPTRTEIHVTVPKGEHLADIKTRKVPVRVVTDAASGKSLSSNVVFYTYIENIVPKKPESRKPRKGTTIKVTVPANSGSQTNSN